MDRYTRHKLKSDKFSETVVSSSHWAAENRGKLIGVAVIVAVAVLAVSGFSYHQNNRQHEANDQLAKAFVTMEAPLQNSTPPVPAGEESYATESDRSAAAFKAFSAVADGYPHTDAGHNALYMAGVTAAQMKDNDKAEKLLTQASDGGNKDVSSLAKLALANLYHSMNRDSDAIKQLEELRQHPTNAVPATLSALQLGSIYEKTDPEKAKQIYGELQKNDKDEEGKKIAMDRMSNLSSQK